MIIPMRRWYWYRAAARNLGLSSLLRLQTLKRSGSNGKPFRLTAKTLAYPVFARRASSDLDVFHQIFVEREYRCVDHVKDPTLIIDLGANVGYSSAYFLSRYENCIVLAVEPDPDNFALLKRNVAPYGNRCRPFQAAVWWRNEALQFKSSVQRGDEWAHSVEPGASAVESVRSITIPELLQTVPGSRISILKIDIEGSELELFSHNIGWIEFVDNMVIELHGEACQEKVMQVVGPLLPAMSICGELTCFAK
jgi:FkbM family methyltransferase